MGMWPGVLAREGKAPAKLGFGDGLPMESRSGSSRSSERGVKIGKQLLPGQPGFPPSLAKKMPSHRNSAPNNIAFLWCECYIELDCVIGHAGLYVQGLGR
jgi:hypothetical protein